MLPGGGFTTAQLVGMALLTQYFLEKEICYVAQASFKLLAILLPHFLSSGNDWCMPLYPAGTTFSTTIHLGYFHLTCSDVTWSGGYYCIISVSKSDVLFSPPTLLCCSFSCTRHEYLVLLVRLGQEHLLQQDSAPNCPGDTHMLLAEGEEE